VIAGDQCVNMDARAIGQRFSQVTPIPARPPLRAGPMVLGATVTAPPASAFQAHGQCNL